MKNGLTEPNKGSPGKHPQSEVLQLQAPGEKHCAMQIWLIAKHQVLNTLLTCRYPGRKNIAHVLTHTTVDKQVHTLDNTDLLHTDLHTAGLHRALQHHMLHKQHAQGQWQKCAARVRACKSVKV
jgi:hypothetical protein